MQGKINNKLELQETLNKQINKHKERNHQVQGK
jgi:hypothetical protein